MTAASRGGGGGGAFSPADIANLFWRLDATTITGLANAAVVTQWSDTGGGARHATQATAAMQPTYRTAGLNGLPSVRFDGGDFLSPATFDLTATAAITIFAVASASTGGAHELILSTGSAWISDIGGFVIQRWNDNAVNVGANGNVGASRWASAATLTTTPKVISAVLDFGQGGATEAQGWVDGTLSGASATATDNTGTFQNAIPRVGAYDAAGSFGLIGDIGEMLFYARALTTVERQQVETYLKTKWGTA